MGWRAGCRACPGFYAAGLAVAIGTDSLASSPSLNLFDELAELRRIAPDVSAACLLESATRVGRGGAWIRPPLWDDRAGQTRRPGPCRRSAGCDRCGRISGQWRGPRARPRHDCLMFARLRTYASFVRFSHSVFALPFALAGALLAARLVTPTAGAVACGSSSAWWRRGAPRWDSTALSTRDSTRAIRAPRCASFRAAPCPRAKARSSSSCGRSCSWPASAALGRTCLVLAPVALGDCVLVLAREAVHVLHAAVSWPRDGRRARRRLDCHGRSAASRCPGCSGSRLAPGSAGSTCSMPARISRSTGAKG